MVSFTACSVLSVLSGPSGFINKPDRTDTGFPDISDANRTANRTNRTHAISARQFFGKVLSTICRSTRPSGCAENAQLSCALGLRFALDRLALLSGLRQALRCAFTRPCSQGLPGSRPQRLPGASWKVCVMKVQMMPIEAVTPYDRNPRRNRKAVDKVAQSLKAVGWRQPIVVDADKVIIVGHTRWLAAQKLGHTEVPVHVAADLPPAKVKAYRIADNRTGEEADWDDDLLRLEMADLIALDVDLNAATGVEMTLDELWNGISPVALGKTQWPPPESPQ
jgi:hypothetical protein